MIFYIYNIFYIIICLIHFYLFNFNVFIVHVNYYIDYMLMNICMNINKLYFYYHLIEEINKRKFFNRFQFIKYNIITKFLCYNIKKNNYKNFIHIY